MAKKVSSSIKIEIEKGVPLPSENSARYRKYPFGKMVVGDSFVVGQVEITHVRMAMSHYGKRNKMLFRSRRILSKDGMATGNYRVWRVE